MWLERLTDFNLSNEIEQSSLCLLVFVIFPMSLQLSKLILVFFFPDLNLEKEGKYKGHFISVRVKETRAYPINASCPARGVQVYRSMRGLGPLEMDKEKNYHRYEL